MAEIPKAVALGNHSFGVAQWARNIDDYDLATMRANDVVVVLGGIIQFVVGAGTLKIDLVNQVQAIQQGNHAKDGRIIGAASLGGGELLDLLQRQRSSSPEEGVNDAAPSSGNAEAFSTESV